MSIVIIVFFKYDGSHMLECCIHMQKLTFAHAHTPFNSHFPGKPDGECALANYSTALN